VTALRAVWLAICGAVFLPALAGARSVFYAVVLAVLVALLGLVLLPDRPRR
jgi:hypothetical protein